MLLTDWIDWPWWAGLAVGSPLAGLLLFDDATGDWFFGDDWAGGGGDGGVGGGDGGGGDGG